MAELTRVLRPWNSVPSPLDYSTQKLTSSQMGG